MTKTTIRKILKIGQERIPPVLEDAAVHVGQDDEAQAYGRVRRQLSDWAQMFRLWDTTTEHDELAVELQVMTAQPTKTPAGVADIYPRMVERIEAEL